MKYEEDDNICNLNHRAEIQIFRSPKTGNIYAEVWGIDELINTDGLHKDYKISDEICKKLFDIIRRR